MTRMFEDRPAVREATPLLIGLIGPSGTGKTMSALRLATGVQRVSGGDIFVIDTESRRALHYADKFKFRHVPFGAPFSPLDYLEAIEHCIARGAKNIIIDSMSHEHESVGGVLEEHALETKRLAKLWKVPDSVAQLSAWGPPKQKRRKLINSVLQMPVNFIFSFRAKEKLKIKRGEDPKELGFMPICGDEFIYEMSLKCLLLPGADGVPTWHSENMGEKMMIKLPQQFRHLFQGSTQLSEDTGEELAKWAAGDDSVKSSASVDELLRRFDACSDMATARVLQKELGNLWEISSATDRSKLKAASAATAKRIKEANELPPPPPEPIPDDIGDEIDAAPQAGAA